MSQSNFATNRRDAVEEILALSSTHDFSATDLEANRAGKFGKDQERFVLTHRLNKLYIAAGAVVVMILFRVIWASIGEEHSAGVFLSGFLDSFLTLNFPKAFALFFRGPEATKLPTAISMLLLVLVMVVAFSLLKLNWALLMDVFGAKVDRIQGRLEPVESSVMDKKEGSSAVYTYLIGGMTFVVGRTGFDKIMPYTEYIVYYAPKSKALLSLEPILAPK